MTLADWVKAARAHKDWTLAQLGSEIGRSKGAVGHWENGKNDPSWDMVQAIHRVTGYPLPGHASAGVAHELSHSAFDTPVSIRLEPQMPGVSFPESFLAAVPDGAVSPEFPPGLELQWSTLKAPQVGSLVIIRTKHGQVAVRQYRQGKEPGRWIAAATADAFASFDSIEDGLHVLAVATWRPI